MIEGFFSTFSVLLVMIGLMGLTAWAVKRFGLLPGQPKIRGKEREIKLLDSQTLDARNRLVVVSWRGRDYLIGTGQNGVKLIDTDTSTFGSALAAAKDANREEK